METMSTIIDAADDFEEEDSEWMEGGSCIMDRSEAPSVTKGPRSMLMTDGSMEEAAMTPDRIARVARRWTEYRCFVRRSPIVVHYGTVILDLADKKNAGWMPLDTFCWWR